MNNPNKRAVRYIISLMAVFLAYYYTAKFGLSLSSVNGFAALIWPPTGIAIAAVILGGTYMWPAIFAGAFLVNFSTGASISVSLGIALGNTLECIVALYLLKAIGFRKTLERVRDIARFILIAAFLSPVVSSLIGVTSLLLGHVISGSLYFKTWLAWWSGDVLGALVAAPLLLVLFNKNSLKKFILTPAKILEIFAIIITLLVFNFIIFEGWFQSGSAHFPMAYLLFIPFVWGSVKYGLRLSVFLILIVSCFSIVATYLGHGPFMGDTFITRLVQLQIFIGTASTLVLLVSSSSDELKESRHVVSLANKTKDKFLAILTHELRNPLASIVSSLEVIKYSDYDPTSISESVPIIDRQVRNIGRLLDDLLDITRINMGKIKLVKKVTDVKKVLEDAIETVQPLLKINQHKLYTDFPAGQISLETDPLRLEQAVVNLLTNSIKYTPKGGKIYLSAKKEGHSIVIKVKDNGRGIKPEILDHIFESPINKVDSYQESDSIKGGLGMGLGIGLILTKNLIQLHGGTISAYSEGVDKGSEFTISLPARRISDGLTTSRESLESKESLGHMESRKIDDKSDKKILVVDDNIDVARSLTKLLNKASFDAEFVSDGATAIQFIPEYKPNVVILDIGLPDMTGYEVAKKIRDKFKNLNIKLIALTGYGQADDKTKARESGFDHHLTKPVSFSDLALVLK